MEFVIFLLCCLVKSLLFNMKESSDFEVHRNWKDITTTTPIKDWYFDERSKWTLDYPPLFAYMEKLLGIIADFLDHHLKLNINIHNNENTAVSCLYFQRLTVLLLGDLLMFLALKRLTTFVFKKNKKLLYFSILFCGSLILIDNIHFQYNGVCYGLFILSISYMLTADYFLSAFNFAILLNFKHIFLYFAPAYFIFILRNYVLSKDISFIKKILRFLFIGFTVIGVFVFCFFPFIVYSFTDFGENANIRTLPGGIKINLRYFSQIFSRLFPTARGLLHAYWAPNFWALYAFVDKIAFYSMKYMFKFEGLKNINTTATGKVQVSSFNVLPDISLNMSNIIVCSKIVLLLSMYFYSSEESKAIPKNKITKNSDSETENNTTNPYSIILSKTKQIEFIKLLFQSGLIFYLYGYQVHEKAMIGLLIVTIIWAYLSEDNKVLELSSSLDFLSLYVMSPLLHERQDYFTKTVLLFTYTYIKGILIKHLVSKTPYHEQNSSSFTFQNIEFYLFFILDFAFVVLIPTIKEEKYINLGLSASDYKKFQSHAINNQFFPIMLISALAAMRLIYISLKLIFNKSINQEDKKSK